MNRYAKIKDTFFSAPAVRRALHREPAALSLFARGVSYAASYHTPIVPDVVVRRWLDDGECSPIDVLVDVGLWKLAEGGYEFRVGHQDPEAMVAGFGSDRDPIPEALRRRVLEKHGRTCGICDSPIEGELHIDHIKPVARGGRTLLPNLQPAHATCNMRKGARG